MDKEPSRTTRPTAPPTMSTPSPTPNSPTPADASSSSASASATCPRCARAIPAHAALGACPHCLLAAGFASEPAAPDHATLPPTVAELAPEFPQLELLELLGRGGMGAVYKARQKSLDRLVALKLLRPGLDADPSFAERFTREARALAQLNHPGIVTLYEFGRTPGGLYFILMEFVDGLNLRQLLAAGRLSPREALAIIPPLCDALQYAHDRGLIHRDIKPENILIDRLGRVKIADFGLAKLAATASDSKTSPISASDSDIGHWSLVTGHSADGETAAGQIFGTPGYMAPEQRERPDAVDHRADIYALGVVLYQLLTGELPDAKQLQPPSQRVHLDIRLDAIVLRALETSPSLRFAAVSEFKTQLETVASSALPPPPPGAPTSPSAHTASSAAPTSPANSESAPSAPPPFRLSAISSRPRLKFWLLRVAPLSLLVMLALRFFVIAPYRIEGSSVEPEIPAGSLAFVYKLTRHFSPGDIVAYHHTESLTYVARVDTAGPVEGKLSITRRDQSLSPIPATAIIGKVVFNTRSSPSPSGTSQTGASTQLAINAVILLSFLGLLIWIWKALKRSASPAHSGQSPALPNGAFVLLCTLHLAWAFSSADELPARVASHFGIDGRADGYMSKTGYLVFICVFPLALGLLLQGAALLVRWLPPRYINIPHRDIWLAPARRPQLIAILRSWSAALSCGLVIFSAQLHTLTLLANRLQPPRLPDIALFTLLGFPFILLLWSIGLLMRLAEPQTAEKLHTRRSLILALVSLVLLGVFAAPTVVAWQQRDQPSNATTISPSSSATPSRFPNDAIRISSDGNYFIGATQVPLEELHQHFTKLGQQTPAPTLRIRAERNTAYPRIVALVSEARKRSVTKISFDTGDYEPDKTTEPDPLAMSWLHGIDEGRYAESWQTASATFRQNVTESKWTETLTSVRSPLGKVIERRLSSSQTFDKLPEEPVGPRIILKFDTRFEQTGPSIETVRLTREEDGNWRASSYLIRPQTMPATPDVIRQAEEWLRLSDDARYAENWTATSPLFKQALTQSKWETVLKSVRAPLGAVRDRRLASSQQFEKLPGVFGGPHIVFRFTTRFENKPAATETITFTRDTDGVWRASGYIIK